MDPLTLACKTNAWLSSGLVKILLLLAVILQSKQLASSEWHVVDLTLSRITLWGQSAGAGATDMYLFSFYENPLVRASVSSSGVALGRVTGTDFTGSNFTFVAKNMGCDFEDAQTELQCMRRIPMDRIENFVGQYQDNSTLVNTSQPSIAFIRTGKY